MVLVLVLVLDMVLDMLVSMEMYNMYDSRDLLLIYCGRLVLFRCVRRSFFCRLCFCMFLITSFILVSVRRRTNTSFCVHCGHRDDSCCSWMLNKVHLYKHFKLLPPFHV